MYFAQNNSLDKFELYISFLSDIIISDNENYKSVFNKIIEEAHLLTSGKIDYSKVSSETFDVVSILAFNHSAYFKSLDTAKLSIDDYKKISSYLQEDIKQLA